MKNDTLLRKLLKWAPILIVLAILIPCAAWLISYWTAPYGESRVGITKEEAQSLVVFPICIPAYIPPGVDTNPEISFVADAVNDPNAREIWLTYRGAADQKTVFEVNQRHTPYEGMLTAPTESSSEGAKVSLLNWMFPWRFFYEPMLNAAKRETKIEITVIQTNQIVWWLYEIVDPRQYRSTMTQWVRNHVEYRIMSYLSAEEIKKVTLSMFECSALNH